MGTLLLSLLILQHFFKNAFLFYIIVFLIVLLIISFINTIYTYKTLKIDEEHVKIDYHRGDRIEVRLTTDNKIIFPMIDVEIKVTNLHLKKENIIHQFLTLEENSGVFTQKLLNTGTYQIEVTKILISDYFNILKLNKKLPISFRINVYPIPKRVTKREVIEEELYGDGETIDEIGMDYTEVFGFHEYHIGDDMKHIHPKLSAKFDNYIIKEGTNTQTMIYHYPFKKNFYEFEQLIPHLDKIYQLFLTVVVDRKQYFYIRKSDRDIPIYNHFELYQFFDEVYEEFLS